MTKPTLYLLMGYPGSGKTTVSKFIHQLTGAVHLWADQIRRERSGDRPTYSQEETKQLYDHLNQVTEELLATGQSVIYDTNFNFFRDRQLLREMAAQHSADVKLVWVRVPKAIAQERATRHPAPGQTRVLGNMSEDDFNRLAGHLEEPRADEAVTILDGAQITADYIQKELALSSHDS